MRLWTKKSINLKILELELKLKLKQKSLTMLWFLCFCVFFIINIILFLFFAEGCFISYFYFYVVISHFFSFHRLYPGRVFGNFWAYVWFGLAWFIFMDVLGSTICGSGFKFPWLANNYRNDKTWHGWRVFGVT